MCSICGILGGNQDHRREVISAVNETMKTRGPDQNGIYLSGNVSLGHNRLAIIDVENGIR